MMKMRRIGNNNKRNQGLGLEGRTVDRDRQRLDQWPALDIYLPSRRTGITKRGFGGDWEA